MQQLIFTEAWDRTISSQDRQRLETLFQQTKDTAHHDLSFTIVRIAVNHHNHLLVTVLIHNTSNQTIDLTCETIHLLSNKQFLSKLSITDPRLRLPTNTSMPWTFIFTDVTQPAEIDSSSMEMVTQA
ncbi:SLAP domain-containing protein [Gracilibacillus timonensis]|uniref:SLAP domain-containing protein n=1 Tax=Gracilibacillus timonensis TaxID=1816696 RepID=UPI0008242064|nr:SLAP domain-containing protein [Gracilibacillus timonensis]